jgi:PAS domain S-box-containing protein
MAFESSHIIDALPGLVWTAFPDGRIDFLNQRWCQYTGLSSQEASGFGWQNAILPADLAKLLDQWRSIVASGQSAEIQARLRRFDGEYRWFLFRLSPLAEVSGEVTKWCGINTDIEDHKQTEGLRESQRKYRQIVDSIPGLVCTMSPLGKIEQINQQVLEYYGKTPAELKGWEMTDAVHPDDLPRVITAFKNFITTGIPYEIEHRCRRADGVYRWFQIRALPVRDVDGSIAVWYVLMTDIEDRKRAEDEVRASERRLNQIINTIPTTVWSTLQDGSCDFLNQRWLDYTGLTEDAALGWGWTAAIHPDDLDGILEYWKSSLATGAPVDTEVRMRRYDGVYRWFLLRGDPLRDESGTIIKWYGTNVDIEDRKRAVDELRRSEARKTAILDSALDCIMTIDHEGCFTEFNPAAERTFGHQRENVLGQLLAEVVIPPSLRERHRQGLARYLATGETVLLGKRVELMAIRADGSEFPVEVAITRIPSDGPPSFTGYLRDITERKRAEQELRQSESALRQAQAELAHVTRVTTMGELAVSIAHEINQPIAGVVINGNACLRWLSRVKEESIELKEAREAIQRIIRDGTRAGEIINRIRALFRKTESAKEPLDLNETIREIIVLARSEMDKQRVVLHLELSSDLPYVAGDRVQLQQVFLNLIVNAIESMAKFEGRTRDLVIQTQSRDEREVMVTVRDSGVGLLPENIEHVFTAFHTTKPGGLGMGLSISRSIVENHSGRLWVTVNEGPGVSFHFTLPSYAAQSESDVQT